jgi:hypothetical protein
MFHQPKHCVLILGFLLGPICQRKGDRPRLRSRAIEFKGHSERSISGASYSDDSAALSHAYCWICESHFLPLMHSKSHLEQTAVSAYRNSKCLKANRLALFELGLHDHAHLQPHTAKPPVHGLKQLNSSRCASATGQFDLIRRETRMKFLTNRAPSFQASIA